MLLPGATALLLSLAGALGLGPILGGAGGTVTVLDVSASCEALDDPPEGAILCRDSRLGLALKEAERGGAKRILLLTDACDLSGEAPAPPLVPVDVTLLKRRDDLKVLRLRAPDRIPVGTDFGVEVVLGRTEGRDAPAVTAAVTLFRDGERVGSPRASALERGQTARILIRDRVDREGVVLYRAVLDDALGDPADDTLECLVRIGERPLVVSIGEPLDLPGFDVKTVAAAEASSAPFEAADAILVRALPDVPAQERIAEAVRAGTGLVVIGGRGVAGGPLERVLPLTDAPPEGRATVLLLDVSGSMHERMDALAEATEKLLRCFRPDDRVAFVLFSDRVDAIPWQRTADARIDLRARRGEGNTLLEPALAAAERMLGEAKGHRRLFVVSDGEWKDSGPVLAQRLAAMAGIHRAALFVQEDVKPESKVLFPVSLTERDDLALALKRLEDTADDRTVIATEATAAPPPAWLEGAVPPAGAYRDFVRLYPRGVGETIVLAFGEIPVVAAWRPGGKVVLSAPSPVDAKALVRAVLKDTGGVRLRAWRDGDEVVAEASGSAGAPFVFDGVTVPARPVGPGRWRATARRATRVACGGATVLVEQIDAELLGLRNRPDIAAAIVASSGGTLVEEGGRGGQGAPGVAVFLTLLLAAVLVVVSAWRRRKA